MSVYMYVCNSICFCTHACLCASRRTCNNIYIRASVRTHAYMCFCLCTSELQGPPPLRRAAAAAAPQAASRRTGGIVSPRCA